MKKILVPTDFSYASGVAIDYGLDLANAMNAKMVLFNAYHLSPYAPEMYIYVGPHEIQDVRKEREKKLSALCDKINKRAQKPCSYLTREGKPAEEILNCMEAEKPYLTVVGAHGASALEKTLFGSVTVSLARKTQLPLLIVPENCKYCGYKKIVYATDYHESDIEAIRMLTQLGRKFGSEIVVLHVFEDEISLNAEGEHLKRFEKELRSKLRYKNLRFKLVLDKRIATAIEDFVDDEGADLVAVARVQRSVFLRVFAPSITKKMIYHTNIPLLVFNAWDLPSEDF